MKYYIETFGCQMNKNDSELIELSLQSEGFIRTNVRDKAAIVIYNTCSVREAAEWKAFSHIREARGRNRKACIVIAGCMAQRTADEHIKSKLANIAIGPYEVPQTGKIVRAYLEKRGEKLHLSQNRDDFSPRISGDLTVAPTENAWHRFVTITHGCENYCTYCIVPYVRGKLISFSSEAIIDYIKKLIDSGVSAITLLGQNVNQYGQDNNEIQFHQLLEKIAQIRGLNRISFLTSHPKDVHPDLIKVIRDNPVISRGIHLPLQSGSDEILKRMNRQYDFAHYMSIIDLIKKELTDYYSITTDLIVGFPGETEADFQATLRAVETIGFSEAFTYAYSPRKGTAACDFTDDIDQDEKMRRLDVLIALQRGFVTAHLKDRIGKTDRIIIERKSTRSEYDYFGKTHCDQPAIVRGENLLPGTIAEFMVTDIKGAALYGNVISQ
jgi:tRNA-2-methylthio-N6-dimethylallyladenosine synthase